METNYPTTDGNNTRRESTRSMRSKTTTTGTQQHQESRIEEVEDWKLQELMTSPCTRRSHCSTVVSYTRIHQMVRWNSDVTPELSSLPTNLSRINLSSLSSTRKLYKDISDDLLEPLIILRIYWTSWRIRSYKTNHELKTTTTFSSSCKLYKDVPDMAARTLPWMSSIRRIRLESNRLSRITSTSLSTTTVVYW